MCKAMNIQHRSSYQDGAVTHLFRCYETLDCIARESVDEYHLECIPGGDSCLIVLEACVLIIDRPDIIRWSQSLMYAERMSVKVTPNKDLRLEIVFNLKENLKSE